MYESNFINIIHEIVLYSRVSEYQTKLFEQQNCLWTVLGFVLSYELSQYGSIIKVIFQKVIMSFYLHCCTHASSLYSEFFNSCIILNGKESVVLRNFEHFRLLFISNQANFYLCIKIFFTILASTPEDYRIFYLSNLLKHC